MITTTTLIALFTVSPKIYIVKVIKLSHVLRMANDS